MARGIALNIGLNAVDPRHYAGWSGELNACEADAEDMTDIARTRDFDVTQLLTTKATRAKVIGEIERAAAQLGPKDMFFVSYSGHGGQVPDTNEDEPDLQDETWCLYDGELLDDELYALWTKFKPGVRILMLSDSCHSGSVARQFLLLAATRDARALVAPESALDGKEPRPRTLPQEIAIRTYRQNRDFYRKLQQGPSAEESEQNVKATVRLISGCQDDQVSLDGTFNGLFTGTLLRVWKDGAFTGSYAKFHAAIKERMPITQRPNHFIVGARDPEFDGQTPFTI